LLGTLGQRLDGWVVSGGSRFLWFGLLGCSPELCLHEVRLGR
jgi:hypothetical protein